MEVEKNDRGFERQVGEDIDSFRDGRDGEWEEQGGIGKDIQLDPSKEMHSGEINLRRSGNQVLVPNAVHQQAELFGPSDHSKTKPLRHL